MRTGSKVELLSSMLISYQVMRTIVGNITGQKAVTQDEFVQMLTLGGDNRSLLDNLKFLVNVGVVKSENGILSLSAPVQPEELRVFMLEGLKASLDPGVHYVWDFVSRLTLDGETVNVEALLHEVRNKNGVAGASENLDVKKRLIAELASDLGLGIRIGRVEDPSIMPVVNPTLLSEIIKFSFPSQKVGVYELLDCIDKRFLRCMQSGRPTKVIIASLLALERGALGELVYEADAGPSLAELTDLNMNKNLVRLYV